MRTRYLGVSALMMAAGCGGDDGTAPTIRDLTYAPAIAPTGQATTVSGGFQFEDPDGDLDLLGVEIILPSGQRQEIPRGAIPGADGVEMGPVAWAMILTPPSAGSYGFELFVVDGADHESNRLTGTIVAP